MPLNRTTKGSFFVKVMITKHDFSEHVLIENSEMFVTTKQVNLEHQKKVLPNKPLDHCLISHIKSCYRL